MKITTPLTVEAYLTTLEEKGTEAAQKMVVEAFGVEGTEGFNEEAFMTFSSAAIEEMINRNNKWAEDIRAAHTEEVADEAPEEVVQDEAQL